MKFALYALIAFLLAPLNSAQAGAVVQNLRIGDDANKTRVVLELSESVAFTIFALNNPRRIVLDLPPVSWKNANDTSQKGGVVKSLRFGQFSATQSRLVLDLAAPVQIVSQFLLPPTAGFPHRLVIDLARTDEARFAAQVAAGRKARGIQKASKKQQAKAAPRQAIPQPTPLKKKSGKKVIVIDAGHGGLDPGALGKKTQEKIVTLAFARELAKQLRATGRYEVHLTRDRDIYIPLRQRVSIARKHRADLFISIHADAIKRKNVRGLSVYTLSEKSSDKEAAALARKENQSDIIAGVDLGEQPSEVSNILLDLSQRETKNLSARFAGMVTKKAKAQTRLLERPHRFAGFRVLKAPDVPSVLIETGFLTNRQDEKQLLTPSWRRKVVRTLVGAVDAFFASTL